MKWLTYVLALISTMAWSDSTIPFVAFHHLGAKSSENTSALYGLARGTSLLVGSSTLPVLSDQQSPTVATYVPGSVTEVGLNNYDNDPVWNYSIQGFKGTAFRGSSCTFSCGSGFTPPVAVSDSSITLKYVMTGGIYSQNGLILSEPFFNYLAQLSAGSNTTITTSVRNQFNEFSQKNTVHKLGDFTLSNMERLEFAIDPISGQITLKTADSKKNCVSYTRNTMPGVLCSIMSYTYRGESTAAWKYTLSLSTSKVNPILYKYYARGLNVEYTFDEKLWTALSNASTGSPAELANNFMEQPQKYGGTANMKMFFPNDFISAVATGGNASDLTDIMTLCISAPYSMINADFCVKPGDGIGIRPIAPDVEITPDNPDYTLDPDGLAGSGKGKIGDSAPIAIPYTITTTAEDPAMAMSVRVTGNSQSLNGHLYCLFRGIADDSAVTVPVPGFMTVGNSKKRYAHNCSGRMINIDDPYHSPQEWNRRDSAVSGLKSWHTPFILEFQMDDPVSLRTYSDGYWDGVVNAQGTIEVSASWK